MSENQNKENFQRILRKIPNGNYWAPYGDLDESIKNIIKQEDKFTTIIFDYKIVVKMGDKGFIFFANPLKKENQKSITNEQYYDKGVKQQNHLVRNYPNNSKQNGGKIKEVQAVSIENANTFLSQDCYELIGADPVKVVQDRIFVIIGKREEISTPTKEILYKHIGEKERSEVAENEDGKGQGFT